MLPRWLIYIKLFSASICYTQNLYFKHTYVHIYICTIAVYRDTHILCVLWSAFMLYIHDKIARKHLFVYVGVQCGLTVFQTRRNKHVASVCCVCVCAVMCDMAIARYAISAMDIFDRSERVAQNARTQTNDKKIFRVPWSIHIYTQTKTLIHTHTYTVYPVRRDTYPQEQQKHSTIAEQSTNERSDGWTVILLVHCDAAASSRETEAKIEGG